MTRIKIFSSSRLLFILAFLVSLTIVSCGGQSDSHETDLMYTGYLTKGDNTIVLDDSSMNEIVSITENGSIVFSSRPSQIDNIAAGNIIVISACNAAPNGALVKVESVDFDDGGLVIHTSNSSLDQAVANADFSMTKLASAEDVEAFKPMLSGVSMNISTAQKMSTWDLKDIVINFDNTVIYDADNNLFTSYDQVRLNGDLTISPKFEIDAKINWFKLTGFTYKNTTQEVANLSIVNGNIETPVIELKKEVEVARMTFGPIVFVIEGFPIVITPDLIVKVGVDGRISYQIEAGFRQESVLQLGVEYSNKQWKPTNSLTLGFGLVDPKIDVECNVKGYVSSQFDILLYGAVGPYIEARGYLQLDVAGLIDGQTNTGAKISSNGAITTLATDDLTGYETARLSWQMNGGFAILLGVKLTAIAMDLLDYSVTVYDWHDMITNGYVSGSIFYDQNGLTGQTYSYKLY